MDWTRPLALNLAVVPLEKVRVVERPERAPAELARGGVLVVDRAVLARAPVPGWLTVGLTWFGLVVVTRGCAVDGALLAVFEEG